jgi:hypothetical protein
MMLIISVDLNPRDDLESLAYTLLFLLKGSLPWQAYSEHGTTLGRITQVREQKRAWIGSKLARGCPHEFGHLVDYARGLNFPENIDYNRLRAQFSSVRKMCTAPAASKGSISPLPASVLKLPPFSCIDLAVTSPPARPPQCPVKIGQLVSVQILARTSIERYSLQGLRQLWRDPLFSSKRFPTCARPAIIIDIRFDEIMSLFMVQIVSVGQGPPSHPAHPAEGVSGHIAVSTYPSKPATTDEGVVLQPAWPRPDTYCYAFPRAPWFYCVPEQVFTSVRVSK